MSAMQSLRKQLLYLEARKLKHNAPLGLLTSLVWLQGVCFLLFKQQTTRSSQLSRHFMQLSRFKIHALDKLHIQNYFPQNECRVYLSIFSIRITIQRPVLPAELHEVHTVDISPRHQFLTFLQRSVDSYSLAYPQQRCFVNAAIIC